MYEDHTYLIMALRSGISNVKCPQARASLVKLGYMSYAKTKHNGHYGYIGYAMALTKKGQRRAEEILKQINEDRALLRAKRPRGIRGRPWPKSWKIAK